MHILSCPNFSELSLLKSEAFIHGRTAKTQSQSLWNHQRKKVFCSLDDDHMTFIYM